MKVVLHVTLAVCLVAAAAMAFSIEVALPGEPDSKANNAPLSITQADLSRSQSDSALSWFRSLDRHVCCMYTSSCCRDGWCCTDGF